MQPQHAAVHVQVVAGALSPAHSRLDGPGLLAGQAGVAAIFQLRLQDAFGNAWMRGQPQLQAWQPPTKALAMKPDNEFLD